MCNQTVGLVQRAVEAQGVSTVGVSLVRTISERVMPPRTYYLQFPFGHAMGDKFKEQQQFDVFNDCLAVLKEANSPGVIIDSKYRWDEE